jgi:ATP-dependent HslUV protease subunit HslV
MGKTMTETRATTILLVRRNGRVAMAGDGQVTFGQNMIMKQTAQKVRRLNDGAVLAGFAGATADAFTLFELFEEKLRHFRGNLLRAAVELTREWRKDKYLRRLEAMLLLADAAHLLVLSGNGDVIEPDDDATAIGSGGPYALAAARALLEHSDLGAEEIARAAMGIAADICVYTNRHLTIEVLAAETEKAS